MKTWFTALVLVASLVPAIQASQAPAPEIAAKEEIDLLELLSLPQAKPASCPGSFCLYDWHCTCSFALTATCGPTGTCVYTYPGNPTGPSGPQSGDICLPARFCQEFEPCGPCQQGGTGVCGSDSVCRIP